MLDYSWSVGTIGRSWPVILFLQLLAISFQFLQSPASSQGLQLHPRSDYDGDALRMCMWAGIRGREFLGVEAS